MWTFIDSFNTREQAIATWLFAFLLWILFRKDTRSSILGVVKAFFHKKILRVVLAMLVYTALTTIFFGKIGLWDISLTKDTTFWIVGTALVLLMNTNKATQNASFFKETAIKAL